MTEEVEMSLAIQGLESHVKYLGTDAKATGV